MSEPSHLVAWIPIDFDAVLRYLDRELAPLLDDAGETIIKLPPGLTAAQWFVGWQLGRRRSIYLTYDDAGVLQYIVPFLGEWDAYAPELAILRQIAAVKERGEPGYLVVYSAWGDVDESGASDVDAVVRVEAGSSTSLETETAEAVQAVRTATALVARREQDGARIHEGGAVDRQFARPLASARRTLDERRAAYLAGWQSLLDEVVELLHTALRSKRLLRKLEKLPAPDSILDAQRRGIERDEQTARSKFGLLAERGVPASSRTACEAWVALIQGDAARADSLYQQARRENADDPVIELLAIDLRRKR